MPDGDLTPEQRDEIVALANLHSRSRRAPEIFVLLAELWVSSRVSPSNTAGFVSRKRVVESLSAPFCMQALHKLLAPWSELGLVEVGTAGIRAGPKLREIVDRQVVRPGAVQAPASALPNPVHTQPTQLSCEPHAPELLDATIDLFVNHANMLEGMSRSQVYCGLSNWKGSRSELVDCMCGILAGLEQSGWPKDPFLTMDEMRRGVSRLKPVNAETFTYFKVKQIEAQKVEAAQKAGIDAAVASASRYAIGQVMAEFQAKSNAELVTKESEQHPPAPQIEEPAAALKLVPQGPSQIPEDISWGQPRPQDSEPAA